MRETMSIKDYHARAEISKSDLDLLAKSPYHFKFKDEFERKDSAALTLGSAVHKLILEPKDFFNENRLIELGVLKNTEHTFASFLNSLSEDEVEENALNKEELLNAFIEYIIQMKHFLRQLFHCYIPLKYFLQLIT